jgi:hypothetical protein
VFLQISLSSQSVYLSIIEDGCGTVRATDILTFAPPKVVFCVFLVVADWGRTKAKVGYTFRRLLVEQVEVYDDLTVDLTVLCQWVSIWRVVKRLYLLTNGIQTETAVVTMGYAVREESAVSACMLDAFRYKDHIPASPGRAKSANNRPRANKAACKLC